MTPRLTLLDMEVLQTAASLENLAVSSYAAAARLRAVGDGMPALATFIGHTAAQHAAHANAFNAALARAGSRTQHAPDRRYATPVRRALASLTNVASVVSLLEFLEDVKAQSYVRYASLTSPVLRSLFASVAAIEAEHRAFLLAALKLLDDGEAGLARLSASASELPEAIGARCFPQAFYPTADASAIDEGAIKEGSVR